MRSEFNKTVSAEDRVQDENLNQFKLKIDDTYKKDEKITTNFERSKVEDYMNKDYLDGKLSKTEGDLKRKIILNSNCLVTNSLWKRF